MTKFLTTTALSAALFATTPAIASSDLTQMFLTEMTGENLQASELIGMRVYAAESGVEGDGIMGLQDGWEDIGEINDIVLSRGGNVEAVIVDMGGFLGLGERQVAMKMDALQLVSDEETEDTTDFFIVVPAAAEALAEAPEFEFPTVEAELQEAETAVESAAANVEAEAKETTAEVAEAAENAGETVEETAETAAAELKTEAEEAKAAAESVAADAEAAAENAATEAAEAAEAAGTAIENTTEAAANEVAQETSELARVVEREGYEMAKIEELTTDDLTGARVYDANGEWIGEIDQLNVNDSGQIERAVIDVGGFLGLGEKPVLLELAEMDIMREADDGDFRVEVTKTKAELEAMPRYED
ncbi:PRC-barrel domain-containing protein [Ovoidimarina sediminis]|uniref:PRC-barrel domain-containing protein n=1 Tax=Ovoidimarina sediminis TaxID=3079856 RepID=UPI0029117F86|nr:PRC-barrel domain-containing protein [Rhodophyticola sp. MJ-SS7]MDU8944632.1 PRC-barrel domain-containing protein [Rhodophyticola sp. MJ-SS7]